MAMVLVVDDSPVSQRLLSYTLQRAGYTVVMASNGCEALDILQDQPVDLVISDLAMPEMDGLTLLEAIRADQRLRALQLVMLTASGQEHDRSLAQAAGASDFLTKPTSTRDLLATVGRLVG